VVPATRLAVAWEKPAIAFGRRLAHEILGMQGKVLPVVIGWKASLERITVYGVRFMEKRGLYDY
jgi:hypothetical protein